MRFLRHNTLSKNGLGKLVQPHVLVLLALITVSVVCFALMLFFERDGTSDGGLADGTYEGVYIFCVDTGESVTDGLTVPFVGSVSMTHYVYLCSAMLPDSTVTYDLNFDVDTASKAWGATRACQPDGKLTKGDIVVDSNGYDDIGKWFSCVDDLSVEVDLL